jgi:hypothetical protein
MDYKLYSVVSSEDKRISALASDEAERVARVYFKHEPLTCPFRLTDAQYATIQAAFPTQHVAISDKARPHEHPVAAFYTRYAYDRCKQMLRNISPADITEIGTGFHQHVASHNCILMDSNRDRYRYAHTALNQGLKKRTLESDQLLDECYGRRGLNCKVGAQNCQHPARHAFAVHSLYDFPFQDIYKLFANKGLQRLISCMYLPPGLAHRQLCHTSFGEQFYKFKVKDDVAVFELGDFSMPYTHSYQNWKKYLTVTTIFGNDFNIVVDVEEQHGSFFILKFIRIGGGARDVITRSLPYGDVFHKLNVIPELLDDSFRSRFTRPTKFLVAHSDFVQKVASYILRMNRESLKTENIMAYATGLVARITYNGKVLHEGIDVSFEDMVQIVFSIMCIVAATKFRVTQALGIRYEQIGAPESALKQRYRSFREFVTEKWNAFCDHFSISRLELDTNHTSYLTNMRIVSVPDLVAQNSITCHYATSPNMYYPDYSIYQLPSFTVEQPTAFTTQPNLPSEWSLPCNFIQHYDPPPNGLCAVTALQFAVGKPFEEVLAAFRRRDNLALLSEQYGIYINAANLSDLAREDYFDAADIIAAAAHLGHPVRIHHEHEDLVGPLIMKGAVDTIYLRGGHFVTGKCECVSGPSTHQLPNFELKDKAGPPSYKVAIQQVLGVDYDSVIKSFQPAFNLPSTSTAESVPPAPASVVATVSSSPPPPAKVRVNRITSFLQRTTDNLRIAATRAAHPAPDPTPINGDVDHHPLIGGGLCCNIPPSAFVDLRPPAADLDLFNRLKAIEPHQHDYLDKIHEAVGNEFKFLFEVSAAPYGFIRSTFVKRCSGFTTYVGPGALITNKPPFKDYGDFEDLAEHPSFPDKSGQIVLIDIGPDDQFEKSRQSIAAIVHSHPLSSFCIKVFFYANGDSLDNSEFVSSLCATRSGFLLKPRQSRLSSSEAYLRLSPALPGKQVSHTDCRQFVCGVVNPTITHDVHQKSVSPVGIELLSCPTMVTTGVSDIPSVPYRLEVSALNIQHFKRCYPNDDNNPTGSAAIIQRIPEAAVTITVNMITGPAGCGKTTAIRKHSSRFPGRVAYVAPQKLVKQAFEKDMPSNMRAFTHVSFLMELSKPGSAHKFDAVFVDEAFQLPVGYYGAVRFSTSAPQFLLGDPMQIGATDFNDLPILDKDDILSNRYDDWSVNTTYRYGPNIADYLSKIIKRKIVSLRTIDNPVRVLSGRIREVAQRFPNHKRITFSREGKAAIDGNTIHEVTGSTFRDGVLYVADSDMKAGLIHNAQHHYVGVSRFTNELVVYLENPDQSQEFRILGSATDMSLVQAGIHVSDDVTPVVIHPNHTNLAEALAPSGPAPDTSVIESILRRGIKSANHENIIGVVSNELPAYDKTNGGGTVRFNLKNLKPPTIVKGKRLGVHNFCRSYRPSDTKQVLDTMFGRYTKDLYKNRRDTILYGQQIAAGFLKYTKFSTTRALYDYWRQGATPEVLKRHALDYICSVQKKIGGADAASQKALKDLETDVNSLGGRFNVDFFMKNQPKVGSGHSFDETQKFGQGISSYPKLYNLFIGSYFRYINESLHDVLLPCVQFASGACDREIGNFFNDYRKELGDRKLKKLSCDISEFDTTHAEYTVIDTLHILDALGMPHNVQEVYLRNAASWTMTHRDDFGPNQVFNCFYMMSGRADTLTTNTRTIIGLTGMCFDISGLVCASFKGDDSLNIARSMSLVKGKKQSLAEDLKVKIKIEDLDIPEYIAMIFTPHGPFPDVLRRSLKVLSNVYVDDAEWKVARKNMKDALDIINNNEDYNGALLYASEHYKSRGFDFSTGDLELMYRFLFNLTSVEVNPGSPGEYYIFHQ